MAKKRLILSSSQLDEICGVNASYCDDQRVYTPNEIYSTNVTGDVIAKQQGLKGPVGGRVYGMGQSPGRMNAISPATLEEINKNIQGKVFGGGTENKNKECKRSPDAVAMAKSRYNKAQKQLQTSQNPLEKQKAANTIKTMKKNAPNLETQIGQFDAAVRNDENIRKAKVKNNERVLAKHTKESGNGKAHSKKTQNGNITYFE